MSVQVKDVRRFDQVRFRGPGSLKITQGDTESLTIHAPAYLVDDIESDVKDQVLHLGYVSPRVHPLQVHREIISYRLCMRDIRKVALTGSGRVLVPDLDNDAIKVEVSGSGQVVLENLTADRFEVSITGPGSVAIAGDVEEQIVRVSGAGSYSADRLVSDFADVRVSGAGEATVSVSDELLVAITGSGKVTYAGYPDVTKHISGSGKLIRKRRQKDNKRGEQHGN